MTQPRDDIEMALQSEMTMPVQSETCPHGHSMSATDVPPCPKCEAEYQAMSVSATDNTVTCPGCSTRFQYYGVEPDAHCPECSLPYPVPDLADLIDAKGPPMADDSYAMREARYGEELAAFYHDEMNAAVPLGQDRGE